MSLLRKKPWWQKLLSSRLTLAAVFVFCAVVAFAVYDRYVIEREVAARREAKEAELENLASRQEVLEKKVEYLKGEEGMEAEIRSHFDVAREGEKVVVITGETTSGKEFSTSTVSEESSWWPSWWPF